MATRKSRNTNAWSVLKAYALTTMRYPWLFALILAAILSVTAAGLIAPLFLKEFINLVVSSTPEEISVTAVLFALGFYALAMFGNWAGHRLQMVVAARLYARSQSDLVNESFAYLIHHGHDFFINSFAGTLTGRVSRYAKSYQRVFSSIIESMMPTLLFATGVIVVLYLQNHWLGIGLLVWTLFFLGLQYVLTKWRYQYKVERAAADSRLTGALSDSIGNHSAIALFAAERLEKSRLAAVVADWYDATLRVWRSDSINYAIQGFLTRAAQVGLLLIGFYLWLNGSITVGDLVLIQVYILSLMEQISGIGSNLRQLYEAFSEADEMITILEKPHAIMDSEMARELEVSKGQVTLESVAFEFADDASILTGFNLTVAAGEKIALVGPSGAGKSTITKLLLRLYDVTGGAIRIDGQDIRDVTQESLRRDIAFVPQESILFHRTLRENIAYGREDATLEEVIEAAKKAHCHEFISGFPLGYDTLVGERGVKLSGGERQRVAIARAILKDAPILILDEATSSLDSESEALIQDALNALMQGKTVIVIAHRLSTIMRMDRIIVIEDGAIAAQGTHDELVTHTGGLYQKLWSIQAGGFLDDSKAL